MRLSGGGGPRTPPDAPSALERRRGQLLTLGGAGIVWEVIGAVMGGTRGPLVATAGFWLTLASAAAFVGNLAVVLVRSLWRRWRG